MAVGGALAACSGASTSDETSTVTEAVTGTCATAPIVDRSLFVASVVTSASGTDTANAFGVAALKNFSFESVLNQIVATGAKGSSQTALELYDQLVDTLNIAPGDTSGPHCTGKINGFPVDCPRPEGALAKTNPFTGTDGDDIITPVALVNRFDLAPSNGANCGQYRIVFAANPGKLTFPVNRFLLIFEAVLPNPTPSKGISACLPVAQFWDDLSASTISEATFASRLKSFYFDGIAAAGSAPAFVPVIRAQNYGIGSPANTNTGQIRLNMLSLGGPWQLREFRLSQSCTKASVCTLTANNTPVQDNPFGALFAKGATGVGATFQSEFISQVPALAAATIPLIAMSTPNVDNAGQSNEQDLTNDYAFQAGLGQAGPGGGGGGSSSGSSSGGPPPPSQPSPALSTPGASSSSSSGGESGSGDGGVPSRADGGEEAGQDGGDGDGGGGNAALSAAIQAELTKLGSKLTPLDIVQRATTQSCAGCHQLSPGTDIGGGLTWPASNVFTQVDETGHQSPALTTSFLPFRRTVLQKFIDARCGDAAAATEGDESTTVSGKPVGSPN